MDFTISANHDGMLLRTYLFSVLHLSHRIVTHLKQIAFGITLNQTPVTVRAIVHTGDRLFLALLDTAEDENTQILPVDLPIEILYEDDWLYAVCKPAGMPTHPTHGHYDDTLANALTYRNICNSTPFCFRAVNRLDRNTSGIVLVAKHKLCACLMAKKMQAGEIEKQYLAVVVGVPAQSDGVIDLPIRRAEESIILREVSELADAEPAKTRYRVIYIAPDNSYSILAVRTLTGRTHQIRVHFAAIGHPLMGDSLYGTASAVISRHALHATILRFTHPQTNSPLEILAPPPPDLCEIWKGAWIWNAQYHNL